MLQNLTVLSTAAPLLYGQTAEGASASNQEPKKTLDAVPRPPTNTQRDRIVQLSAGEMVVEINTGYGSIHSIRKKGGSLGTNFIGNPENTPGVDPSDSRWTGDLVTTVWDLENIHWDKVDLTGGSFQLSGKWQEELTGRSADIRKVSVEGESCVVRYAGTSKNERGVKSYGIQMRYHFAPDGSLLWDIELHNNLSHVLEIGELGFPLMVNNHYAAVYRGESPHKVQVEGRTTLMQKRIHEEKVLVHHFVGGHSSYALVQRPLGDPPFLLVHPTGDTAFECVYKPQGKFAAKVENWEGPDVLAAYSRATKNLRHWAEDWVNGHTSLVLQPGEKRSFQLRFVFVDDYQGIREELYKAGNLGIRIVPSMVVQENTEAYVELKSKADLDEISLLSDGVTIKDRRRTNESSLLTLSFKGRGQKSLKLVYGGGKWTDLHFYCVDDVEGLIKSRAQFIVDRQFYENPADPFHRHHMFLPFDDAEGSTFTDSEEVWEVGGSDEFGFSEPLFLAEKNVYFPSKDEVKTLETYVADCLFKYIQDPETYAVRASLYWKHRAPSSPWGDWSKERSETTWRTYNYPHPANIYHALYRIGKEYGILTRKSPQQYLRMSHQTCMKWFNTGPWKHVGLMGGSNVLNILEDIKSEGWTTEYEQLLDEVRKCNDVFVRDPYPYGSELFIDQTAHEQVFFFTRYFGDKEKTLKTLQVIKALRGGNQPVWFRYGNDKRGDMACWYSESLNGMALLKGFEETGDSDMFVKGYAGMSSVSANLRPDGMGFGWFISSAGAFGWNPSRTLDNGIGQYGFFKAAKAYVIEDASFGTIGCGCGVETTGETIKVRPRDGLRKRLLFFPQKIGVEVLRGEILGALLYKSSQTMELQLADSTGLVNTARMKISGLPPGQYLIAHGKSTLKVAVSDHLDLEIPIGEAALIRVERI
jgi:Family of unknown function (DUF5695)